jgi:proline iminopeptidase
MIRRSFVAGSAASFAFINLAGRVSAADAYASGSFSAAGGKLGYRRFGQSGPIHVLLSGGPGLESNYVDPIAVELARDRTIVVFDQRGTGTSRDALGDGSQLTVAGAIADLDGLREALGLQRLSLLGHSWGAMLSMAYAAAHRERVASLALLDPGGADPSFFKGFSERVFARLTPADKTAAQAAQTVGPEAFQLAILPGFFHDHEKGVAFAAARPAHYWNQDVNQALIRDLGPHYDLTLTLPGMTLPVLIVYGSDDPSLGVESQLEKLFPRATKAIVTDAGHFPWLENPKPFYAAIRSFLASAPAPS